VIGFFLFQAEDGIRDFHVTGVQTCALPIYFPYKTKIEAEFISLTFPGSNLEYQTRISGLDDQWSAPSGNRNISVMGFSEGNYVRSEERRVGKEGRSGRAGAREH